MAESDEMVYSRFLREHREEDLRILLERYRESLTLFLCSYVHSMEDAEELMLDAFAEAVAATHAFSGKSSFKTWLFAIGRNLARRRMRKRRFFFEPLSENDVYTDPADSPEISLLKEERNAQLYRALEGLHEDYRQALFLVYFEEMDHEEAAAVMSRSAKQMYNLISRGRQALKNRLKEMGFEYEKY